MNTIPLFEALRTLLQSIEGLPESPERNGRIELLRDLIKHQYDLTLCYVYVEHYRQKHKRIKKRMITFSTGDIFQRRFVALDYMEQRREILLATGMKFNQQVWLQNNFTGERFVIAGRDLLVTLYGLAKEAEILFLTDLEKVQAPFAICETTFVDEDGTVGFSGMTVLDCLGTEHFTRPMVFSLQNQVTYELSESRVFPFRRDRFLREVDKYEKQLKYVQTK